MTATRLRGHGAKVRVWRAPASRPEAICLAVGVFQAALEELFGERLSLGDLSHLVLVGS